MRLLCWCFLSMILFWPLSVLFLFLFFVGFWVHVFMWFDPVDETFVLVPLAGDFVLTFVSALLAIFFCEILSSCAYMIWSSKWDFCTGAFCWWLCFDFRQYPYCYCWGLKMVEKLFKIRVIFYMLSQTALIDGLYIVVSFIWHILFLFYVDSHWYYIC